MAFNGCFNFRSEVRRDLPYQERIIMFARMLAAITLAVLGVATVQAHEYTVKDVKVEHPYARATVQAQATGAAYLTLENKGSGLDRLVSVSVPAEVAAAAQIHTMSRQGDLMKMREVDGLDLPPATKLEMRPGNGYHIMLIGLKKPLTVGDKVPLTLTFANAGSTEVALLVEAVKPVPASSPEPAANGAHAHH